MSVVDFGLSKSEFEGQTFYFTGICDYAKFPEQQRRGWALEGAAVAFLEPDLEILPLHPLPPLVLGRRAKPQAWQSCEKLKYYSC
ncbi:hypothetical protein HFO55_22860 [Rhizobium leguminosarum]|uniref:hypothetical protein n=1 Tax=Rhizobium leguminosarum TaxID=384 RepID=UPI001D46F265|nr:hypothetical protein [Rhizobium leguminosarum]MBY5570057.1 hypothetical protein [Rhizobium leguminosarum]MBY5576858.1 hypothetical protein [Rhizobium leguminosarum]